MQSIKLTPRLDLLRNSKILKQELQKISRFFNAHNIEWYIQSSFAVRMYGVKKRAVTDIDIRANYPIKKLFALIKKEYSKDARLRPPVRYEHGEFRNSCIIIPFWRTHIDIMPKDITTYNKNDKIEYKIPFDTNYKKINFDGLLIPICSIQYLIIYLLIHRRGRKERKNQLKEAEILLKELAKQSKSAEGRKL